MCFRLQFPFQTILKLIYCISGYTHVRHCISVINYSVAKYIFSQIKSTAFLHTVLSLNDFFFDLHHM